MVTLLKPIGHCFGVLKAIEIAKKTKEKYKDKNIYVFGLLVHNEEVVKDLENNDIKTIEMNEDTAIDLLNKFTPDDVVIFSAHGHPLIYEEILNNNHVTFVDATCTRVQDCFTIIKNAHEVIYIGKSHHPETVAALTMNKNTYLYDINNQNFDYASIKSNNPLVINQTTLSFLELKEIHEDIKNHLPHALFHDEICNATYLRQQAISSLGDDIDTLIIVGSQKSSNTMKLYEIAKKLHPSKQILLIKNVDELKDINPLYKNVAIASGTSTSYQTIAKIEEYLKEEHHETK